MDRRALRSCCAVGGARRHRAGVAMAVLAIAFSLTMRGQTLERSSRVHLGVDRLLLRSKHIRPAVFVVPCSIGTYFGCTEFAN